MVRYAPGLVVRRRLESLESRTDAHEIARLSLVVLNGNPALTYALFTVAFMKQVAVPTMARTLYRHGHGDIVTDTVQRNDDTLAFFGHMLDHGPHSPTGAAWIERLNEIHAHFPLRNEDSLYTLATLALDPHALTTAAARSPFSPVELDAHWKFWRDVAVAQHIRDVPNSRRELEVWAAQYENAEYAPSEAGRAVTAALIAGFAEKVLPRRMRPRATDIVSAVCTPALRDVHGLPEPTPAVRTAVRLLIGAYAVSEPVRPVDITRSLAADFDSLRRPPAEVGYRRVR